jgi:thiamine pyrophosphokinase
MYIFKDNGFRFEYEKGQHYIYIYNDYSNKEIDLLSFDWHLDKTKLNKNEFLKKCNRYLKERGIENEY